MTEFTEQQIAEMKLVVEKMPEVFRGVNVRCLRCEFVICHKLMKWLGGKEYWFSRSSKGHWNAGMEDKTWARYHGESLWPCLYAAWQHWEAGQQLKKKTLRERIRPILDHGAWWSASEESRGKLLDAIEQAVTQHIEGKRGVVTDVLTKWERCPSVIFVDAIMAVLLTCKDVKEKKT